MAQFFDEEFPRRLSGNRVALTLNLHLTDLAYLAEGREFYSHDEIGLQGEEVAENLARLHDQLGLAQPERFVSLALRTARDGANTAQTLGAYGHVVLEIDIPAVSDHLVIVNGDFKGLALKVATETVPDVRWAHRLDHRTTADSLAREVGLLVDNGRKNILPRLVGSYFEARLMRPLVPGDIVAVYARGAADDANVRILCGP